MTLDRSKSTTDDFGTGVVESVIISDPVTKEIREQGDLARTFFDRKEKVTDDLNRKWQVEVATRTARMDFEYQALKNNLAQFQQLLALDNGPENITEKNQPQLLLDLVGKEISSLKKMTKYPVFIDGQPSAEQLKNVKNRFSILAWLELHGNGIRVTEAGRKILAELKQHMERCAIRVDQTLNKTSQGVRFVMDGPTAGKDIGM